MQDKKHKIRNRILIIVAIVIVVTLLFKIGYYLLSKNYVDNALSEKYGSISHSVKKFQEENIRKSCAKCITSLPSSLSSDKFLMYDDKNDFYFHVSSNFSVVDDDYMFCYVGKKLKNIIRSEMNAEADSVFEDFDICSTEEVYINPGNLGSPSDELKAIDKADSEKLTERFSGTEVMLKFRSDRTQADDELITKLTEFLKKYNIELYVDDRTVFDLQ